MKRGSAFVGAQGRSSRLGILSLLTMMILVVSVGKTFAADDVREFKLWHKDDRGNAGVALKHLPAEEDPLSDRVFAKIDEMLVKNEDYTSYVIKYQNEPFEFMEGIRKVVLDEFNKKGGEPEKLLESIKIGLESVRKVDYGDSFNRRNGYHELLEKLLQLPKDKLKNLLQDPDFLKKLFAGDEDLLKKLLIDFDLTDKKSDGRKPPPTPSPTPSATPSPTNATPTPVVDEEAKRRAEEIARQNEALRNEVKDLHNSVKEMQRQITQPTAQPTRTGEFDDSRFRSPTQYSCDNKAQAALQQTLQDFQKQFITPIRDALNKAVDDSANRNPFQFLNAANQRKNDDKQLADILLPLLQEQNRNQAIVPPPPQTPALQRPPQTASNDQTNPNLNQPIQPQEPPPQPPSPGLQLPSSSVAASTRDFKADLPSHSFKRNVIDANAVISEAARLTKQPVPNPMLPNGQTLPPPFALMMLEPEQQRTSLLLSRATSELDSVKEARAKAEDELEQLKDGARSALPSWVKAEEQRLQSEAETKKKNFEQRKQFAQQAAQDPQLRDQIQAQVMQEQQEVTAAEQELAKWRQKIDAKVEEGNKDIQVIKSNADRLAKAEKELASQVDQLTTRKTDLDNKVQMQYMTMMQPPQQPQQPTTSNVNRIQQMGSRPQSRSAVGQAMQPQRGNAGGVVRGSLGGALGSMSAGSASSGQQ